MIMAGLAAWAAISILVGLAIGRMGAGVKRIDH